MYYTTIKQNKSLLDGYKSRQSVLLTCTGCGSSYGHPKNRVQYEVFSRGTENNFCSDACNKSNNHNKKITVVCDECNSSIIKIPSQVRTHNFCSKSCSASYSNKHKTHGTRVSKLEKWIQTKLSELYPNLPIEFNSKTAINSELDIYIPSLKLAFELNGIFHYEPIYGHEKLSKIQHNDNNKFYLCQAKNISLCVIDTSSQKYFKESTSKKFLDIIKNVVDGHKV